jgi:hypothetical protein
MKPFIAALAAAASLAGASAQAASRGDFDLQNARQLGALCAAQPDDELYAPAIAMCHGFLAGSHAVHAALIAGQMKGVYCVPADAGVTRDAAARAFAAWAATAPQAASLSAVDGLMAWARQTYPCPN